jgi:hypothetical protein
LLIFDTSKGYHSIQRPSCIFASFFFQSPSHSVLPSVRTTQLNFTWISSHP